METSFVCVIFFLFFFLHQSLCQQMYLGNDSCSLTNTSTEYVCSASIFPCASYFIFKPLIPHPRSHLFYYSRGITLGNNNRLFRNVECECWGSSRYFIDYTIKSGDSYEKVAKEIFQGLTSCSSLRSHNDDFDIDNNSSIGRILDVPLRCACPTKAQKANGVESLAVYTLHPNETIGSVARDLGVEEESVLEANRLSNSSQIYPFTPLLVPLGKSDICRIFGCDGGRPLPIMHFYRRWIILILVIGGVIVLLSCFFCGCKGNQLLFKSRRLELQKKKFFRQNGGLLLQHKPHDYGERVKIFSQEELERATDNYSQSRFLGQGGFGTVYKGILHDNTVVAIKKSKQIETNWIEQFINEVIVLSQINHINIVRLLGCCLETEFPLLVYEFVSNGTLSDHIHKEDPQESPSLSWENRLNIAYEVAGAISYMHSAASIPILHRDIKSLNILLDDNYSAKVSDFGTSRFLSRDQSHLTTKVLGTFGYIDPEYFRSSQYTEKSDVYSFGVLMVELLTGKQPISVAKSDGMYLLEYFISLEKTNQLVEILDITVAQEETREVVNNVARLATTCLKSSGKERPTMKQVYLELEGLRKSQNCFGIIGESN